MRKITILLLALSLGLSATLSVSAADRTRFDELQKMVDSAKVMETNIFAPKVWKKGMEKYRKANEAILANKNQKTLNKHVEAALEYVENSIKATEIARLSLAEYLEPREKAIAAKAPLLVSELYGKAEKTFMKASAKVEDGNVKSALKIAAKAMPMFDLAEIEAVRVAVLGAADRLIAKAIADDAKKFAPSTFDKANSARTKANAMITNDRYGREVASAEASRAEYQARHSSNIALSVRALKRNDQAWEKLMLLYEIQMNRIGTAANGQELPFDQGPLAAADAMITYITELQETNASLAENMGDLAGFVTDQLQKILAGLDWNTDETDPLKLIESCATAINELKNQKSILADQVMSTESELNQLRTNFETTAAELASRTKREDQFRSAKTALNPSEGEVLFNSSNDIVLRLGGLSFDSGKDQIKDEHIPLLEKVKGIIETFPQSMLIVEGHTDSKGEQMANVTLSEKRAFAVMQYLRQSLLLSADQIKAMGYGADRPIASNQNVDGRAKNRRIDIIIMQ